MKMNEASSINLKNIQRLLQLFVEFFEYPSETIKSSIESCKLLLATYSDEVTINEFAKFSNKIMNNSLQSIEEAYIQIFDMNSHFHPYIGAHIFEDSYKRSYFLVKLKDEYRTHNFEPPENELPDHITVILQFLSKIDDLALMKEFLENFIVFVYNKVLGVTQGYENPNIISEDNNDEIIDVINENDENYNPLMKNDYGDDPGVTEETVIENNNPYYYLIIAVWHLSKQISSSICIETIKV